jgi:hypothetical protein
MFVIRVLELNLHEIQAHYDNLELEMFTEKLQMFMYFVLSKEHKVSWLKQWKESRILKEAKKLPKIGIFKLSIRQMVAQGNILVLGKTSNFLVWLSIFNVLSNFCLFFDFCSLKLRHSSCILPQSLASSSQ